MKEQPMILKDLVNLQRESNWQTK